MSEELKQVLETGLKAVEAKLEKSIEKYEGQLAEKAKVDTETRAEVKALSEEFKTVNAQIVELAQKQAEGFKSVETKTNLTAGEEFVSAQGFKDFVAAKNPSASFILETKNTILSDATTTWSDRRDGIIPLATLPLTLRQVIPSMSVTSNMIETMKEAAWTNSAAETAQGNTKPESSITFAKSNVIIETIAHIIKMSVQLLADAPAVSSYANIRLGDGLAQRIDQQLFLGTGVTPLLGGLTKAGNFVAYTPTAGDNLVDAINRAKYAMWAQGYVPDTVIVNPATWGNMERAKETSGAYLYGLPATQAGMNPWGLNVVLSNHCPVANFMVADMRGSAMLYNRQGTTIQTGYVNDDFSKNLVTIRAEARLGLGVDVPNGIRYGAFTV